jgi:hypothetical protein
MTSWTLHLVNARHQLRPCADVIRDACAEAEARIRAVTDPLTLDIVASAASQMPEALYSTGHCYEPGVIGLRIGITQLQPEDALHTDLLKVLFHEFHHALRWEGPNLLGRPFAFKVIQIAELLDQLVREGRLRTRGKDGRHLTFHDPCQLVRRGGITEAPRRLLNGVSEHNVEMPSAGDANFCCGGGGGVSAIHRAEKLRFAVFELKKQQVAATGADALVTACANCRNVLEEAIEAHNMTLPVLGLTELVARYLESDPDATLP